MQQRLPAARIYIYTFVVPRHHAHNEPELLAPVGIDEVGVGDLQVVRNPRSFNPHPQMVLPKRQFWRILGLLYRKCLSLGRSDLKGKEEKSQLHQQTDI